ncbi:MAG: molybdopterin molybdotransferase MoeA [Porticoccaceae bacterium]
MTDKEHRKLMPLDEARERMYAIVDTVAETEVTPLPNLLGRILAEAAISPRDVPPADNSAMDGYALRHQDLLTSTTLRLAGKALAGQPFAGHLEAGQCVRITTGGEIPLGADSVVMQEDTSSDGNQIHVLTAPAPMANIRRAGEDIARDETILAAGGRLGAVDIGLLASLGIAAVAVRRKLRIALLATGSELKSPGQPLGAGDIYESNRYVLGAMLTRLGAEVIDLGVVADDPVLLRAAFVEASQNTDAVIASGGASVGEADYTRALLAELGTVDFWQVAIKPGKPFIFGQLGDAVFFGLPGNPVSALITFHQLAVPVLRKMQGDNSPPPLALNATATSAIRRNRLRLDLQRGWLRSDGDGNLLVTPDPKQSSAALSSMSRSNCFIWLEPGAVSLGKGEAVRVLPFDDLLR